MGAGKKEERERENSMSRHAVVVVGGRCRKKREKRRQIELEKEGWSKRKARIHPGARQREGGRRREREISKRVEGGRRGDVKRDTVDVYGTRCIGLASREWRWRREKEEKDRVVKLVCRSVTA